MRNLANLRIGRAERETTLNILSEAYAKEQLNLAEHGERINKVYHATTHHKLDLIVEGLTVIPTSTITTLSGIKSRSIVENSALCGFHGKTLSVGSYPSLVEVRVFRYFWCRIFKFWV